MSAMAYYPDNYDSDNDQDSITLQELEPLDSSPYVRISLDTSGDGLSSAERDKRRRQREADRQREAERQKKAAKRRKADAQQKPQQPEPSLHVIIERAPEEPSYEDRYEPAPYDRYDRAPSARTASPREESSYERSEPSMAGRQQQASFPRIPDSMVYRVDEPEPSAPPSVVLPSGGWSSPGGARGGYPGMPSAGGSSGFRSQAASGDIPMYFDKSQTGAFGDRRPKIEPLGASTREASGAFIKRPWSESAFNEHATPAHPAQSQPARSSTSQPLPNPAQGAPQSPTVTIGGFGQPSPSRAVPGQLEQRPFGAPDDPYAQPRGMGSWKRNAAEAVRREQTNNPRIAQSGTVNIKMAPQPVPTADAGNISISHDSLNKMGVAMPQRQPGLRPYGAPIPEDPPIKESAMFEEPPVSIADGMKTADSKRKRRRAIIIAIVAVLVAAAAAVGVLAYTGIIDLGGIVASQSGQQDSSGSASQRGSASGGTPMSSSRSSSASDQSGTVIYEYTATTSDGVAYNVNDTVTYDGEGKCQSTTMKLEFPDESSCADFLANLERDYGSDYKLDAQNGATATVTINIGSLKFDREQYEDALRYSVEELTVLKK